MLTLISTSKNMFPSIYPLFKNYYGEACDKEYYNWIYYVVGSVHRRKVLQRYAGRSKFKIEIGDEVW
jgi:hypothetical protein